MKRSKFTEAQIAFILRQGEEGTAVGEICRKAGISEATYYNWRKKYGGLMPSEMKRLRQLEEVLDHIAERVMARMPVRRAAAPRRAIEQRDADLAARQIGERLDEERLGGGRRGLGR
jgi:putative transposase